MAGEGFARLRQTVLQHGALSPNFWGEEVTVQYPKQTSFTIGVKVTASELPDRNVQEASVDGRKPADEMELIEVLFSKDASSATGALPGRPPLGTLLWRAAERDSDRRPFSFSGKTVFSGDQHESLVFQRNKNAMTRR